MRIAACSLAALLCSAVAGFGQPQAELNRFYPSRESLAITLGHVKLVERLAPTGKPLPKADTRPLLKPGPLFQSGMHRPREVCGHIQVIPAPPDHDPAFIIPIPDNPNDRMPKFKGMRPCSQTRR